MSAYTEGSNGINPNAYTGQVTVHVRRVIKYTGLKMAHLELVLAYNIDIPTATTFITIPENYRPKVNIGVPLMYSNSASQTGFGSLIITSTGLVTQGVTNSMRNMYVDAWYPTD